MPHDVEDRSFSYRVVPTAACHSLRGLSSWKGDAVFPAIRDATSLTRSRPSFLIQTAAGRRPSRECRRCVKACEHQARRLFVTHSGIRPEVTPLRFFADSRRLPGPCFVASEFPLRRPKSVASRRSVPAVFAASGSIASLPPCCPWPRRPDHVRIRWPLLGVSRLPPLLPSPPAVFEGQASCASRDRRHQCPVHRCRLKARARNA